MTKPITPDEVGLRKAAQLPDEVIAVFNDLITARFDGTSAVILQDDAVTALTNALGIPRKQVFERRLLDVEPAYEAAGWRVLYEKPVSNEPGVFTFAR